MRRLQPNRSRCLAGIETANIDVIHSSMIAIQMLLTRSPLNDRDVGRDAERARCFDHARLPWRDQADVALSSAAVRRPAGSSLMPLCRASRRPDLASGVGVRLLKRYLSNQSNRSSVGVQPMRTNQIRCRGGIGAWRSEIKGEPSVIDRRVGHSRSYAAVPPRLALRLSAVFGLSDAIGYEASSARSDC